MRVKRNVLFYAILVSSFPVFFFFYPTDLNGHWKIPSRVYEWKRLETGRFVIHYPEGYDLMGLEGARIAEQAATHLEKNLDHLLSKKIPVFIYPSHQDFSANGIFPSIPGETTGGFTDFEKSRVVLPFNGSYRDLRHVLTHEIVHAYQFDILKGDNPGLYPHWLMEGMAEYLSIGWDYSAELWIKNAVKEGNFPGLMDLHSGSVSSPYMYYKGGQAIMHFIAERYGARRIGFFLKELKRTKDYTKAFESSFQMKPEEFDVAYQRFFRSSYSSLLSTLPENTDERFRRIAPDHIYGDFFIQPALSSDGTKVATLTYRGIFPAIVLRRLPGPDVEPSHARREVLVVRALRSSKYEEYHPLTTRLSFSPDDSEILVTGRSFGKQSLIFLDVKNGGIRNTVSLPFDSIQFPVFSPDGKRIAFVGINQGQSDLYVYSRSTRRLKRYTFDQMAEYDPIFDPAGEKLYFAKETSSDQSGAINVYGIDLSGENTYPVTRENARVRSPMMGKNQSLIVLSDHQGTPNLYRIRLQGTNAISSDQWEPVTNSRGGILHASSGFLKKRLWEGTKGQKKPGSEEESQPEFIGEQIVFTELSSYGRNLFLLPAENENGEISSVPSELNPLLYNPSLYRFPTAGVPLQDRLVNPELDTYDHDFLIEGIPFVMVTGAVNADNQASIGGIASIRMADLTGKNRISTFISYLSSPQITNFDLRYDRKEGRLQFFGGAYRQSGRYAFFDFLSLNVNRLIYNPYFRILDREAAGIYGGIEFAASRFSSISAIYSQGRNEITYLPEEEGGRPDPNIEHNTQSVTLNYYYNNVVYSIYGPLDGISFLASYSMPLFMTGTERDLYTSILDFRGYYLFSDFSSFAFRFFAGGSQGMDSGAYPFRIGGFDTIRGFPYQTIEGKYAFFMNVEYRFNFIHYIGFAVPFDWGAGPIRGTVFMDAGGATDEPDRFVAIHDRTGRTRDLKLSYGAGLQWTNFLWFLLPGALMKIEWATPYDLKTAKPIRKWQGQISFGFNF